MAAKYLRKRSIIRNITGGNNFSKFSLDFKKMSNSSRKILHTYSKIRIFCVIQYMDFQNYSVGVASNVLGKSFKTVLDEVHFLFNLYNFLLVPRFLRYKPFLPPGKLFTPILGRTTSNIPTRLDTSTITLVCIFSSILRHTEATQKNSMIRRWKKIELLQEVQSKCAELPQFSISVVHSFLETSQPLNQDQQNGKHNVKYHPCSSRLAPKIHLLIFL